MTIKAIETRYAGCRFRSRLEARWAVFFDHLNIAWEYEPQGFDLPSGPYLPDFWLPEGEAWVEVKGAAPAKKDVQKVLELAREVSKEGHRVRLLQGDIPRSALNLSGAILRGLNGDRAIYEVPGVLAHIARPDFIIISPRIKVREGGGLKGELKDYAEIPIEHWSLAPGPWIPWVHSVERINAALAAARSARFEHGESGSPR